MRKSLIVLLNSLIAIFLMAGCMRETLTDLNVKDDQKKRTITLELVTHLSLSNNRLGEKISSFMADHPDLEVKIRWSNNYHKDISSWLLGLNGTEEAPDIVELTVNQMRNMFHHGQIDSLSMNETEWSEFVITSADGFVIGVVSKINPLVLYYNKEIFELTGLEPPSGDWDWQRLDNTIIHLKETGHKVFMMISPFTLEWVTRNRYAGRIADYSGKTFDGFLNGSEAVQAAEWLAWVDTKIKDYSDYQKFPSPVPYALINGDIALAVDYAFRTGYNTSNFEKIIQANDQIGISQLPGTYTNPSQIEGLSILSSSPNKEEAIKLLRYLITESDRAYEDILLYSMEAWQGASVVDRVDYDRSSIVISEMKRATPAALYMSPVQNHGFNSTNSYPHLRGILDGEDVSAVLGRYAQTLDETFKLFRNELEAYGECIREGEELCWK